MHKASEQQGIRHRIATAMGIAVEQGKHRYQTSSRGERQASIQLHQQPEHHPGDSDSDLDPWQGQPQHPEQSTEGHHHWKGQGQNPECGGKAALG